LKVGMQQELYWL